MTESTVKLGINGLGRIAKLTLWHNVGRKYFSEIVVNIGRHVGTGLEDVACFIEKDSTYGSLQQYLYGYKSKRLIENLNEENGSMIIDGIPVKILRSARNPREIPWRDNGVELVVDSTGRFTDPTIPADAPGGALRGHLEAGARKVVHSAPFKIQDNSRSMPPDAVTTVMGINEDDYDPSRHVLISNASCSTTCLAFMVKPILDAFGSKRILTASMATVHAATSSQQVLDRSPKAGATDLRKTRSVFNNIILTTTGAARALRLVIPEMEEIGFIAESVRVPVNTGSLIILVVDLQDNPDGNTITRERINEIYKETAAREKRGYLMFTEEQNVSSDIIGYPLAGTIIEGSETHTRTANLSFDLANIQGFPKDVLAQMPNATVNIPVTKVVVYGWYDNEMGSYTRMLGDQLVRVADLGL
ncbi:MAG: glyceraldehyde-3-phosphate dehydrogenase [Deltaproteobacteria bacterium]|nr:glyceraldehyde-3-phosphate dehydrogenase [Deltaproteobacteria bacterium]